MYLRQSFSIPARRICVSARLIAFAATRSGSAAVEFALILPLVILTLLFLISVGYLFFMGQSLDFATQKAARQLRTGAVQSQRYSKDDFRTKVVCPALPSMFSCDDVIVNVQNVPTSGSNHPNEYLNYINSSQSGLIVPALSNSGATYCPGQGGRTQSYIYLQVLYPANIFIALMSSMSVATTYNGRQTYVLMATATFLNEPFSAPASSC